MAEASDNTSSDNDSSQSRVSFYCHQCHQSIRPELPDYTCPNCHSGFIEELSQDEETPEPTQLLDFWDRALLNSFRDHGHVHGPRMISINPRRTAQGQATVDTAGMDFIINHILQTLTGNGGPLNLVHLHGNPGDYAWGEQGLDAIVTQLLNQLEGSGPPPASKEQMAKLPKRIINQSDLDRTLQCSVCFEDYALDETVLVLPCQHVYHDQCIFPWLEKHGTCPVCRKDLEGKDTSTVEESSSTTGESSTAGNANGFLDDIDDCD